jgi:L-fuconolactonase
MPERIDAHHHLWRYRREEFDWIGVGMERIARDFSPADLRDAAGCCEISGSIAVQACQSISETDWLLTQAEASSFIRGVVGWAPIACADFASALERLTTHKKLKGLRHVIQAEPDEQFILRDDFNRGIKALAPTGLVYDILIYERHLPATVQFVDRHPDQIFVLDHIAKPRIKERLLEPWRANIRELARRDNVYCKLSGMVTEADWNHWSVPDLRPYAETVLEAFGPQRLMFGSDWPVCLLACDYGKWFATAQHLASQLSASEQDQLFGGVAAKVYSLPASRDVACGQQQR